MLRIVEIAVGIPVFSRSIPGLLPGFCFFSQQVKHSEKTESMIHTCFQFDGISRNRIQCMKVCIAGGAEISFFSIIRSFFKIYLADGFRNDKMTVGISLSVGMGYKINRHTICIQADICAVIAVETPQENLFCFSTALMLANE